MSDLTLKAILLGDDKSMSKSFKGAAKSAESSSKGIKGHIKGLSGALKGDFSGITSSLVSGISSIGPYGAAAGAALAGISAVAVPLAKESIDAFKNVAGETLKLQRIMGGTAEDASRLRFAFHETGVDSDAAAKAMGIFSKNLVNMGDKTKTVTRHVRVATGEWRKQTTIVRDASGHFKKLEQMVPVTKMKTLTQAVKVANPVLADLGINIHDAHGAIRPMADLLPEISNWFEAMPNGAEKSAMALKLFGKGGLALLPFLNKGSAGIEELTKKSDEFGLTLAGKDLDALKKSRAAHKDWDAAMEGAKVRIGAQLLPMVTSLVTYFTTKMIPIIVKAGQWVQAHGVQIQKTAAMIGQALVIMVKAWVAWETVVFTVVRAVARVFAWLWTNALAPTIHFILNGFATVATAIGNMLLALGHIPGFGWAKKAGELMLGAAKQARSLNQQLDILNGKTVSVTVNTYFKTHGDTGLSAKGSGAGVKGYASGGKNLPAGWAVVGEEGPELMYVPGGSSIYPNGSSGPRGGGGSGGVNVYVTGPTIGSPDQIAAEIQRALQALKRNRGGMNLGLA